MIEEIIIYINQQNRKQSDNTKQIVGNEPHLLVQLQHVSRHLVYVPLHLLVGVLLESQLRLQLGNPSLGQLSA